MSSVLHPVGPASPGVYWFRRVLVIVVVIALLLGVRWLLTGRGGSGDGGAAGPTGSPSASPSPSSGSASPSVSTSASSTASSSRSGSASASASGSASGTAVCPDSAISVTASTDAASYAVGSTPRLRMRIQNTSQAACKRDVGADLNELVISSGTTRVWSSDDCSQGGGSQVATLSPGQSYSVSVTWLGRLSKPQCPPDQPLAQAGTYKLVGRNGAISSAPASFVLTG